MNKSKIINKLFFMLAIISFCLFPQNGYATDLAQIPEDLESSAYISEGNDPIVRSETTNNNIRTGADILLIQTNDPWERSDLYVGANWYDGVTSDTEVLDSLNYTYNIANWDDISGGLIDIYDYPVILIVNDQIQDFYDDYAIHVADFENWVANLSRIS